MNIPDDDTAAAAKWLSEQNVGFDTPTFWLVAGLLANYNNMEFNKFISFLDKFVKAVEEGFKKDLKVGAAKDAGVGE